MDLESPKELHEEHNAYPPAPERMIVQKKWMSEYQYGLDNGVVPSEVENWFPTYLHNKERYLLHYRNLQLYLSFVMRLKKIHRAVCLKQSPWMEPYIRMNTEFRKEASSDFEKDLYKLMNYPVFGKTMETSASALTSHSCAKTRKTSSGALLPAHPLQGPTYLMMTLREFRCTKVICFSTGLCTPACASSTSPSISCTTFTTTR